MKTKTPILFLLLTVLIYAVSCKKDDQMKTISASGTVLNEQTGNPVANITVTLNQSSGSSIGSNSGWSIIDTKTTDNNGKYSFSKDVQDGTKWEIKVNDYNSKYATTSYEVKPNTPSTRKTNIYRNATLIVDATTNAPLGSGDEFFMNLPGIGCNCFSLTSIRAKGGAYNKITWTVTRNNVTQNYGENVYCPVDTVKYYTINY